jgi:flagellar basal-body rod protein FlgF
MDVALSGPGFFTVRNAAGETQYTRGGSFSQNAKNELVTADGDNVMGADGQPITLAPKGGTIVDRQANVTLDGKPTGQIAVVSVKIDSSGGLTSNGVPTGQLAIAESANLTNLRPIGGSKFINAGGPMAPATQTSVLQGAQEKSNANVISSMVGLIANERWFDANEKVITTQDAEVGLAISTVGKTAQ